MRAAIMGWNNNRDASEFVHRVPILTDIDLSQWGEAINNALEEGTPCLLASADDKGYPDIAFKGSMMVFDKDHLAWWERLLANRTPS